MLARWDTVLHRELMLVMRALTGKHSGQSWESDGKRPDGAQDLQYRREDSVDRCCGSMVAGRNVNIKDSVKFAWNGTVGDVLD